MNCLSIRFKRFKRLISAIYQEIWRMDLRCFPESIRVMALMVVKVDGNGKAQWMDSEIFLPLTWLRHLPRIRIHPVTLMSLCIVNW